MFTQDHTHTHTHAHAHAHTYTIKDKPTHNHKKEHTHKINNCSSSDLWHYRPSFQSCVCATSWGYKVIGRAVARQSLLVWKGSFITEDGAEECGACLTFEDAEHYRTIFHINSVYGQLPFCTSCCTQTTVPDLCSTFDKLINDLMWI